MNLKLLLPFVLSIDGLDLCESTMFQAAKVNDGEFVYEAIDIVKPIERQVLIQVKSIGVNRIDLYMAQGNMGPIDVIGVEASGVILALGPDCSTSVAIGDSVACLVKDGSYATAVLADERLLLPKDEALSFDEMAAVPENWLTAYQLLHFEAKIQPGETILLHAAASGVGTAVIQLASAFGAKVIGTAGSAEKIQYVLEHGAIAAFNYKEEDFAEKVMEVTQGAGVQVVLDCVGQSHALKNTQVLQVDGRWIIYGLLSGMNPPEGLLGVILKKRLTIRGTTLRTRTIEYQAKLVAEFLQNAWNKEKAAFKLTIAKTFALKDVTQAHAYMKQNANIGKIILKN